MEILEVLLRYLKGNESESKSQRSMSSTPSKVCCCVTSKVMNLKANHNGRVGNLDMWEVVALPQR